MVVKLNRVCRESDGIIPGLSCRSCSDWLAPPRTPFLQANLEPLEAGSRPKIGLLANEATLKACIYQQKLEARVRCCKIVERRLWWLCFQFWTSVFWWSFFIPGVGALAR